MYPIDQSDGGCDDEPAQHAAWTEKLIREGRNPKRPWVKQTDVIAIDNTVITSPISAMRSGAFSKRMA